MTFLESVLSRYGFPERCFTSYPDRQFVLLIRLSEFMSCLCRQWKPFRKFPKHSRRRRECFGNFRRPATGGGSLSGILQQLPTTVESPSGSSRWRPDVGRSLSGSSESKSLSKIICCFLPSMEVRRCQGLRLPTGSSKSQRIVFKQPCIPFPEGCSPARQVPGSGVVPTVY